jgi:DNA-binding CsgD family transcriptional regulator
MRGSPQPPPTESASGEASRSKWNVALGTVAETVVFENAVHVPFSQGEASAGLIGKCFDPKSEATVIDHWRQCHLSARRIAELSCKAVLGSGDYRKPEERRGCSLYQTPCCEQIFEHEKFPYFTGVKVTAVDEPWCLVLERSAEKGPFSRTELKRLGELSSFLSTAASEIHSISIAQAEATLSIFEVLEMPAAWVDECGCVRKMNQEAEQLFQGADVTCRQGKVVCSDRAVGQDLDRKLSQFLNAGGPAVSCAPLVSIPRGDKPHSLLVSGLRLNCVSQDVFARYKAILTFTDLNKSVALSADDLCQLFHLTSAEARLAVGLANGKSLDTVAKESSIKKHTARHELKSVFSKLSVHRQSELVGLLTRCTPRA